MARIGAARSAPLRSRLTALAWLAALGLGATEAAAAPPQVKAPGSRDQHPLVVRLAEDGAVSACASDAPCKPEDEQRFAVDATAPRLPPKLTVLLLEGGRRVVEVRFGEGAAYFALLVAAAPRSEKAEARLLLSSWIGRPRGEPGHERSGVLTRDDAPGGTRLTVGTWEEGVACGEPSIVSRRRLDPKTLGWEELGAQGIARPKVSRTVTLFPKPAPGDALGPRLFRARSVSSAAGDPARRKQAALALTDGALDGAWVEGAPGPGTGELAVLRAPRPVLVTGIEIVPRATADVPHASTVPASLTVVVGGEHHEAWLRDDPGGRPGGTRWVLELATPVTTDCVAVVLGKPALDAPAAAVALAEVRPTSALDAVANDGPSLVAALALDEPLAILAATALETAGASAMPALGTTFDALPGSAQKRALDVVAALDCPSATEFRLGRIARARDGTVKTEPGALDPDDVAEHELAALRACVKAGDGSLATAIGALAGPLRAVAARELAVADPVPAVRAITDAFGSADESDRRTLRAALSKAAEMRRARPAFESLLEPGAFAARPVVTQIDVLRSLGERLTEYAAAPRALAALIAADTSFRTRYLALAPAAALGRHGDAAARELVAAALADAEQPHLRAEAARLAAHIPALEPALVGALDDSSPRVREAALGALVDATSPAAGPKVLGLLANDPWTFVRAAAAQALGVQVPSPESDEALLAALGDESPLVQRGALRALGRRRSKATIESVRAFAGDARRGTEARIAALDALGELCDADAADLLTKLALRSGVPQLAYDQPLGLAALRALAALHPPDLEERLAPLLEDHRVPRSVLELTKAALGAAARCTPP